VDVKKLLVAVLLSAVLSSLVPAQILTSGGGTSGTNEQEQGQHVKPEPPPAAVKSPQPKSPAAPTDNKPPGGKIDEPVNELRRSIIPPAPGAAAPSVGSGPLGGRNPINDKEFYVYGMSLQRLKIYDEAIAAFDKAIELNPQYEDAYFERGNTYLDKGDHDRAIVEFEKIIRLTPQEAHGYNNRGYAYSLKGDLGRAVADYSEAIRLKPDYVLAYQNRAIAHEKIGDKAEAQADWDRAAKLKRRGRTP
jgi:tetratricopeptide (TPR) repeat protein